MGSLYFVDTVEDTVNTIQIDGDDTTVTRRTDGVYTERTLNPDELQKIVEWVNEHGSASPA